MKRFGFLAALLLAVAGGSVAFAGKTQVQQSEFKAAGKTGHIYGRSDGLFQEAVTGSPYMIENGQSVGPVGKGYRETFAYGAGKGLSQLDWDGLGTCAGNTTTVPCLAEFASGVKLVWFPVVTATLPLAMVSGGLNIASDQTDNDGIELAGGIAGASGAPFYPGVDPAFYFCATLSIADVSGTDDLHIGFREAEAFNATFDAYTDLASIGVISGNITIETILNDAATVTTDTTLDWADTETHKLCTYVDDDGKVTYTVDGAAPPPGGTASYTFTSGIPVIPFVHYLHASDVADTIIIRLWEVGYQQ